jgi:hypothetical protein
MNNPPSRVHRPAPDAPAAPPKPTLPNKYRITTRGDQLFIMYPGIVGQALNAPGDVVNLAAWLVELGGITDDELKEARELVREELDK